VREVLRVTRDRDAEAAQWLEIIDLFDDASTGRSSVVHLARAAAESTGLTAGLRDEWNSVQAQVAGELVSTDDDVGIAIARSAVAQRLRGRRAVELGSALAASIEVGAGRIGVAWLLGAESWRPLDYLVVERLAQAAAAHALQAHERRAPEAVADPAAVERLLGGRLSAHELAQASRRAGLSASGRYVAVALDQVPPSAVSLEALGAVVERAIGGVVRSTVVGRTAAVVAEAAGEPARALHGLEGPGFAVHAGISEAAEIGDLPTAWEQAREALALRRMAAGDGRLAFFSDLGPLHLLAQIPREEVLASELFQRLTGSLIQHGNPSDIDVLEVYLQAGTLRRAAARVYLHHTSVENRLKRIQEDLQVDLRQPQARFEVQLVLKLFRMLQARDASRPVP
jgi:hypothetical protein